jgi:hypothetical protein
MVGRRGRVSASAQQLKPKDTHLKEADEMALRCFVLKKG